ADDLFCGHRKKCASFDGSVIGNEHEQAAANAYQSGDGSRRGGAAPFFVHFERGKQTEFEPVRVWIDQFRNAFAGGEAALLMLRFDGSCAAALADDFFLILQFGEEFDDM